MCLAEALLRIPDAETADALIRDKLGGDDGKSSGQTGVAARECADLGADADGADRLGARRGRGPGAIVRRLVAARASRWCEA